MKSDEKISLNFPFFRASCVCCCVLEPVLSGFRTQPRPLIDGNWFQLVAVSSHTDTQSKRSNKENKWREKERKTRSENSFFFFIFHNFLLFLRQTHGFPWISEWMELVRAVKVWESDQVGYDFISKSSQCTQHHYFSSDFKLTQRLSCRNLFNAFLPQ